MQPIEIVGGTYDEICLVPSWRSLFGSGGRAAAAIQRLGGRALLHTAFSNDDRADLNQFAAENRIDLGNVFSGPRVRFEYLYAMRAESTIPPLSSITPQEVAPLQGEDFLVFGMIESLVQVTARRLVFDPQAGYRATHESLARIRSEQLVLVCNATEACGITGKTDIAEVERTLRNNPCLTAAVIKMGPAGALVVEKEQSTFVSSVPTKHVFPIGSGDVFSGAFAFGWLKLGLDFRQAAKLASFSTARYCRHGALAALDDMTLRRSARVKIKSIDLLRVTKKVYLAGPFFTLAQRWFIEEALSALSGLGLNVFSPLHDVGRKRTDRLTAQDDLKGLESCDAVFAWVDDMDPGTLFEVGYARDQQIPVVMYGSQIRSRDLVMFSGTGVQVFEDFSSALYNTFWAAHG